jgi:hypothetical protein
MSEPPAAVANGPAMPLINDSVTCKLRKLQFEESVIRATSRGLLRRRTEVYPGRTEHSYRP